MAETNIGATDTSDLAQAIKDYEVDQAVTDGAQESGETRYYFTNWPKWYGYYKNIPEFKTVVDTKCKWTIGRGFKADEVTTLILDNIKGFGKDTFNSILNNLDRVRYINGDSFAEIIVDDEGQLLNLKPLDPSSIVVVVSPKGMIKRYEQITKRDGKFKKVRDFKVSEILHLERNRTADEAHGTPLAEGMETLIKMRNESMSDWQKVLHRNVSPVIIWHLDTDDSTQIDSFKAKTATARADVENIYIPMNTVKPEVLSVAPNQTMNPLPWIEALNNYFFQAAGVPDVIIGGTQSLTEASAKIKYLAFQQNVEEDQLYLEEQILTQLNLEIKLNFPASLENEALSARDEAQAPQIQSGEAAVEPNDQQVNMMGKK